MTWEARQAEFQDERAQLAATIERVTNEKVDAVAEKEAEDHQQENVGNMTLALDRVGSPARVFCE